jgi:hypothetical protein
MQLARTWLAGIFTSALAINAAAAPPRFDTTTKETLAASAERLRRSLDAPGRERFHTAYKLVVQDVLCPISPERPHMQAMFEREAKLMAAIQGKSAEDIFAAAKTIEAALDAERVAMREQPPDSPLGREIRTAVRQYLDHLPAGADNYSAMFPFWTQARVNYANALDVPGPFLLAEGLENQPPPRHSRGLSGMALYGDDWLQKLQIQKVLASEGKAYVFAGHPEKSARMTFQRERGVWKAHSDLFGYPWSSEGVEAMECVEH